MIRPSRIASFGPVIPATCATDHRTFASTAAVSTAGYGAFTSTPFRPGSMSFTRLLLADEVLSPVGAFVGVAGLPVGEPGIPGLQPGQRLGRVVRKRLRGLGLVGDERGGEQGGRRPQPCE